MEEQRRNFGFFGHSHRNRNRNNKNGRVPSGRGNEECMLDYLLIPGARGNQTKYGKLIFLFFFVIIKVSMLIENALVNQYTFKYFL